MKTTAQEVEEKRLQRNADRRRRYAQLSHVKKDLLLQKKKEKYAASKKQALKGKEMEHDAIMKLTNKGIAEQGTYSYPAKMSYAHINKGITIRDISTNDLIRGTNQVTSPSIASRGLGANKDNTHKSSYSSIEIGELSLNADEANHSTNELIPDLSTASMCWTQHTTAVTTCETEQIAVEIQPVHIYGRAYSPPSCRRKRSERSSDEETNIIDEIQQFQSARWISASEAMWRIYRFTMNDMHPSVQSLHLHLEVFNTLFLVGIMCSFLLLHMICS